MKLNYARNCKDPTYTIANTVRKNGKISTVKVAVIGKHSELAANGTIPAPRHRAFRINGIALLGPPPSKIRHRRLQSRPRRCQNIPICFDLVFITCS